MSDLQGLYTQLSAEYRKDTDQDFPINKIRFFMDFLWNTVVKKPLTEDQKAHLKQLIDLLNSLDDHKLSPMREMIQAMTPMLTPLLEPYPSLGHTCTVVFTNTIPAYQKYLTSLESQVKDAHKFTAEEILLYYEMTLVDHLIISHVFELETTLNLIEVIETIKTVIIMNALTHDYLQDALGRSISMFTFLQRGGITKEEIFPMYQELVNTLVTKTKENVSNQDCIAYVDFMSQTLTTLATNAQHPQGVVTEGEIIPPTAPTTTPPISESSTVSQEVPASPVETQTPSEPVLATNPVSVTPTVTPESNPIQTSMPIPQTEPTVMAPPVVPLTPTNSGISEQPGIQTTPAVTQTPVMSTPVTMTPPVTAPVSTAQTGDATQKLNGVDDILASLHQQ